MYINDHCQSFDFVTQSNGINILVVFRPEALPSAGLVPFLQSFFCGITDRGTIYNGNNSIDLPSNKR